MNWKGIGHGLIYNTILASGLLTAGSGPSEKSFWASQKGQTSKVKSKEMKQTASHTRWPLATTAINHQERWKDVQRSQAPGPLPDHQAPVMCTQFLPSHKHCLVFTLSEWWLWKKTGRILSVSGPRLKPGTSPIWCRATTHLTKMFGQTI